MMRSRTIAVALAAVVAAAGLVLILFLLFGAKPNPKPGEIVWKVKLPNVQHVRPALYDGVLYAPADTLWSAGPGNHIRAIDARSGKEIRRYKVWRPWAVSNPLAGEGMLFFSGGDCAMRAVDLASWSELWQGDGGKSFPVPLGISGGLLIAGVPHARIYACDARTGKAVWNIASDDPAVRPYLGGFSTAAAVTADSVVFAAGGENDMYQVCLDRMTGALRWRRNIGGGDAVMDESALYVNDFGRLYALDLKTGETLWEAHAAVPELAARASVALAGGLVILRNEAFDAKTGEKVWTANADASVLCPPAIVGNAVCYTSVMGFVEAYDLRTGALLWKAKPKGVLAFVDPAVAGDGLVYCWCNDNKTLYAIAVGAPEQKNGD